MLKAVELAQAGCPSVTVVVAAEQTAGQGRFGRSWHSEPGAGLYMSQVLRLKICPDSLPLVTLALGLATADAIIETAGVAPDLRWPNDVLLNGRKCAGILVQLHDGVLIAGIGINVNQTAFPDELAESATSLRLYTGRSYPIDKLLDVLVLQIEQHLDNLLQNGRESVLRAFSQASSYVRGRRVVVEQNGVEMKGVTDGMDPQGFLFLRQDNGQRTLILAGGVRPA
jgi:BirA family biotin operon repressor/biotin-[acetyl-CoA-carboxylase] ligase